jgi:hypothetical protein
MRYVDLAFRLSGSKVPVDHGYALCSAISRFCRRFMARNISAHPKLDEEKNNAGPDRNGIQLNCRINRVSTAFREAN